MGNDAEPGRMDKVRSSVLLYVNATPLPSLPTPGSRSVNDPVNKARGGYGYGRAPLKTGGRVYYSMWGNWNSEDFMFQ